MVALPKLWWGMRQHNLSRLLRALLAILSVAILSLLVQQWVAVAHDLDSTSANQKIHHAAVRPTLDLSRSPLTAVPLATIRAGLTATALAGLATPVSTPSASPTRPEVPHAGAPFSEPDYLRLIWIGLVCCYVGGMLIRVSIRG